MFNKSVLATSILLALPAMTLPALVYAAPQSVEDEQAEDSERVDEIIHIRGTRSSMSEALSRKRESIQMVDSIVAEDIGKLPNNNVVEALQHVTGVQVGTRTAGEASSILIRGLGQVVTTVNGRNAFTAAGRSFALADIPATMVAGLDVYKTASADMVEGGIGGVIDVRTRRPFDFEGRQVSLTGKATYSDLSGETDPNFSVLVSDRWQTSAGDIGALINLSYVETNYRDQTIWGGGLFPYDDNGFRIDSTPGDELDITDDSYNLVRDAIGAVDDWGKRERPAVSLSFEWAPNNSSSYYLDAFYTGYRQTGTSSFLFVRTDALPLLEPYEHFAGTNVVSRARVGNPFVMNSSQAFDNHTDGYQYALGGEWSLSDTLDMRSELTYQLSKYKSDSQILDVTRHVDELVVNFNDGGSGTPSLQIVGEELTSTSGVVSGTYFDGRSESRGEATSWRLDFDYYRPLGFVESWQFGSRYDIREATANNVQTNNCDQCGLIEVDDISGLMTATPGSFFSGKAIYPGQWATPSASFMLNNKDLMRETFTGYTGQPDYNPTEFFDIEEESLALYGQANIRADIGYNVLDGIIGVRVVRTEASLSGYEMIEDPEEGTIATLRHYDSNSTEILPNITLRYGLTDNVQLRFNASKTITRPAFGDLNPVLTLRPPIEGQVQVGLGDGGNAELKPVEALNFDFGAEYYFGESSAVYGTLFYRDIDNWIQPSTVNETYDGQVYNITRPTNSGSGEMKGIEVGIQYFPESIPDWLQGIGIQASYTYIDAHTKDEDDVKQGMLGVSENSLSTVLVYERGPFSARLSHIYRDSHLVGFNHTANMPAQIYAKSLQFTDFSAGYELTEDLIVTFDATNIFGEKYQDYFGDQNLFNRDTRRYSTTYSVGFRYSF